MGGDHAPQAILDGGLDAAPHLSADDRLCLIGDEAVIREALSARGLADDPRLEVVGTTQVIGMGDGPVTGVREKPDSSIVKMAQLAGRRKAGDHPCDIIISAGNTGACVAAAQMAMRRLPGVHRPGIAVTMPTFAGPVVLCDVGANPEPRATHLHQYAHMAAVYAKKVLGKDNPKVALMSIGEEASKGNALVKGSHALLKADPNLNYHGYIEGRGIFGGEADVVVTEGFTGNVVLKLAESLAAGIFKMVGRELMGVAPELGPKFQKVVQEIYARHDYHEHGGAPLLGANGICFICHGSSEARTITNAIQNALSYAKLGVNEAIVAALAEAESVHAAAGAPVA